MALEPPPFDEHKERELPVPPSRLVAPDVRFGLALSGGGFRSALLGIGVLHYLVSSGRPPDLDANDRGQAAHATRMDTITSVSGGSYASARALLAKKFDLQSCSEDDFLKAFQPMTEAITRRNVWFTWRVFGSTMGLLVLLLIAMFGALVDIDWRLRVGAVFALLWAIPLYGRVVARAIWKLLFPGVPPDTPLAEPVAADLLDRTEGPVHRDKTAVRMKEWTPRDKTVHHVFCTTDLHYTRFTYLSNRLVYNRTLGHGGPGQFSVKMAVDASTAIPPIFAPIALKTRGFLRLPPDSPGRLLSVDGGVYDTLATTWYDIAATIPRQRASSQLPELRPLGAEASVLVVDGSANVLPHNYVPKTTWWYTRRKLPVLWWMASHVRSARLAFSNWDRRNFDDIRKDPDDKRFAISTLDTPFDIKLSEAQWKCLADLKEDWGAIVKSNRSIKVRPTKLKDDQAAQALYHGYAMAWTVFTHHDETPARLPTLEEYRARWEEGP